MNRTWVQVGSLLAFVGVALGAFGAHLLKDQLGSYHTTWETAVQYQFLHAVGVLFLGLASDRLPQKAVQTIGILFTLGVVLFSGSLYVLALTRVLILGAVTPLGGLCFLTGWGYLFFVAARMGDRGQGTVNSK